MVRRVAGAKLLGKVHLHAKTPRQIGVAVLQQVVLGGRADEHDLYLHVHPFRLQRHGGAAAVTGGLVFYAHAVAAQKAPQPLPQRRVARQVAQKQHQKAAMGTQQATGVDAGKVRIRCVLAGFVLDMAEQVAHLRVVLDQHRRTSQAGVVHRQVHLA